VNEPLGTNYLTHFGLHQSPFSLTPDTEFFYTSPAHQEALNVVKIALANGEGFIKIVGEVGLGKTLLCRRLLNTLDERYVTAYIYNPHLTPNGIRRALATELGLELPGNVAQEKLLNELNRRLLELARDGRVVVLFVDEAQSLPIATVEALRLLTNLETEKAKLLRIVIFGQPELDEMLALKAVRQLRQRISFSYRLTPLSATGVDRYLMHRLHVAGCPLPRLFNNRAVAAVAYASRGIPRLVNILAHKAMLSAWGMQSVAVTLEHVRAACRDTEGVPDRWLWLRSLAGMFA